MAAAALGPLAAGAAGGTAAAAAAPGTAGPVRPVRPVPTTMDDWREVAEQLGGAGGMRRGLVYAVSFLRDDLDVRTEGVVLQPEVVGMHNSFVRYADGRTLLMGDLAVTEDELQDVSRALHDHGIAQTAIHKHVLAQEPPMWWCHVHAHGRDPGALARGLRAAVDAAGAAPGRARPRPAGGPDLDTAGIDAALGVRGHPNNGIYQCLFGRRESIVDDGMVLPPGLGSMTALNFQPLGGGRAALIGDFAMVAGEVPRVLRRLTRSGIDLVSLHSHSLAEDPRLFFVHNWAVGDAVAIARALRPALDLTNTGPLD